MGFSLTHLILRLFFLLVVGYISTVSAAVNLNVTIYYNDSSISYSPPGAWNLSAPSNLDLGGAHMLTQNPNATASFNFTGIAIYFVAPLWPYLVNTAVSLDSGPITLIDLVDRSSPNTGQGPETVQYQVVWHATGLANTQHNLLISVGAGQPYAVVDGLIYTTATNVSSSTSSTPLPTSSSSTLPVPIIASSTASATPSPTPKSKPIVAISLGSLFGALGLLIIICGVWYLFRRRRKRPNSEAWTLGSSASHTTTSMSRNPSMSAVGPNVSDKNGIIWSPEQLYNSNGYPMNQSNDGTSWHNPRYEYVGMPAPPIPSQPYYHRGYQSGIGSRTAAMQQQQQHPMTGRMSNRYEPGCALSTITERSTPQMGEGRTPLGNSPASFQSDLEFYTAQGSEASFNVSRQQQQQQQQEQQQPPSPNIQRHPSQRRKPVEYN